MHLAYNQGVRIHSRFCTQDSPLLAGMQIYRPDGWTLGSFGFEQHAPFIAFRFDCTQLEYGRALSSHLLSYQIVSTYHRASAGTRGFREYQPSIEVPQRRF